MSRSAARKPRPQPATTMSVAEVRAQLPDVLRRAENGEEIRITRRGVPVAVVHAIRTEEDERVERLRALIRRVRGAPRPDDGPDDPWQDVRDRSMARPPVTFD